MNVREQGKLPGIVAMYCGRNLEQWSVNELRERLDTFGLSKVGRKAELFVRLCEADLRGVRMANALVDAVMDGENGEHLVP